MSEFTSTPERGSMVNYDEAKVIRAQAQINSLVAEARAYGYAGELVDILYSAVNELNEEVRK